MLNRKFVLFGFQMNAREDGVFRKGQNTQPYGKLQISFLNDK